MLGCSFLETPHFEGHPLKYFSILSKPQPNLNTRLGLSIKWLHNAQSPHHRNSISAIFKLLLTRFWWKFKGRFLWTYSNCQGDICPRNICPRDICPYQEYLSCYWPDIDETLQVGSWKHLEQIPTIKLTFVKATFVLVISIRIRNISAVTDLILMKLQM